MGGKGGVGKTTTAAALAVELADAGRETLVLSVDPAHSLGDALGTPLGPDPDPVPGLPRLHALEVNAELERERFLGTHRGALLALLERGTYLDTDDATGLLDLGVPGSDELAALFRLMALTAAGDRYLVVDTAPTGHTLRLLQLPRVARGWLRALQAMEEKHRAVATALVGTVPEDEVTRLLGGLDADLARLQALLTDPERTRFLLVTTREPVVLAETRRYQEELASLGVGVGGIVLNRADGHASPEGRMAVVPDLPAQSPGIASLRQFSEAARSAGAAPAKPSGPRPSMLRVGERFVPPLDRHLYLVGGKGGVGKSTTACALGVLLAASERGGVLLLSTDPAGSLGDVLGQEVGPASAPVRGVPGLSAQQVDATAAWSTFQQRYREEVEGLFDGLLAGGLSATADQQVVHRLIDLAPPGIDELMALLEVVDATEDRPYDAWVLDTAPTGHLLRLLELPELALEWARAVLRLLLKYREVVGLGELAERVLGLTRSLRALRERLTDASQSWVLVVALAETLSVPETRRLLERLPALGIEPGALMVNRLLAPDGTPRAEALPLAEQLVELGGGLSCIASPQWPSGPIGAAELARHAESWRELTAKQAR